MPCNFSPGSEERVFKIIDEFQRANGALTLALHEPEPVVVPFDECLVLARYFHLIGPLKRLATVAAGASCMRIS